MGRQALRRAGLWALLIAVLLGITLATVRSEVEKRRYPPLPRIAELPGFQLQERDGRMLGERDLAGAPWVASFLFSRCPGGCAAIAGSMADLHRSLPPETPVQLVTITVDPTHDTAAVLRGLARQWGADTPPARWWWLTGTPEAVFPLVREGFLLATGPDETSADGGLPQGMLSSSRLVLVDGDGWIRGYYDAVNEGEKALLRRDLAGLVRQSH